MESYVPHAEWPRFLGYGAIAVRASGTCQEGLVPREIQITTSKNHGPSGFESDQVDPAWAELKWIDAHKLK
jgi:hypothetical protein